MRTGLQLGDSTNYVLRTALLLYETESHISPRSTFLTRHAVKTDAAGVATLGPAALLDKSFASDLIRSMQGAVPVEVLPETVLARTGECLCWWVPASRRVMFYDKERSPELQALSGRCFPQPPLVILVRHGGMAVRALAEDRRPTASTPLYKAPYWNVSDNGTVCLGSTRKPKETTLASMERWEECFFESEFTHPNAHKRLTNHPGGFTALWGELREQNRFPAEYLAPAEQTLQAFLGA